MQGQPLSHDTPTNSGERHKLFLGCEGQWLYTLQLRAAVIQVQMNVSRPLIVRWDCHLPCPVPVSVRAVVAGVLGTVASTLQKPALRLMARGRVLLNGSLCLSLARFLYFFSSFLLSLPLHSPTFSLHLHVVSLPPPF